MKEKFLPIFMIFILSLNVFSFQPKKVDANAAVLRVVGGTVAEAVMVGVAEKIGTSLGTNSARQKSLMRWNYDLDWYYKQQDAEMASRIARMDKLNQEITDAATNKIPLPNKPGFSKVVLSAAAFLTAADIIYTGYSAFKTAQEQEKFVELMADNIAAGNAYQTVYGTEIKYNGVYTDGDQYRFLATNASNVSTFYGLRYYFQYGSVPIKYITVDADNGTSVTFGVHMRGIDKNGNAVVYDYTVGPLVNSGINKLLTGIELFQPTIDDVPVVDLPPALVPLEVPGIDATPETISVPDAVEIIVPDDLTTLSPDSPYVPSNTPIGQEEPIPDPDPSDPPGDEWTDPPTKKIDWGKLRLGALTTVFPFSIPWDVYRLFSVFNVDPVTPVFKIDINKSISIFGQPIEIKYKFDVDFGVFDPIAAIGRWGLILIFDIAMIMALRRLTPD